MTLAMAMILFGLVMIYAGITGRSVRELLVGKITPSTRPRSVER